MENQYNELLSLSKIVSDFYENVYAPALQTLPWIDEGDGLKIASEKVLGNIAFPAYALSTHKNKNDQETFSHLRTRCNELKSIYDKMQNELRPILSDLPVHDQNWEKLKEMIPMWQGMSGSDVLPKSTHKAVHKSFVFLSQNVASGEMSTIDADGAAASDNAKAEAALAKLIAEKIKFFHQQGKSDSSIALTFGSDGFWLDRGFLHSIR
ncbi:Hypothetical predicted protein [Paramuricea clavata]|uniref:Uncharacterized protein n=1 Tax=Paramuricea clavata TaxID=317549 RepID=A0A7D9ERS2_PARCT|nr:Hypothetical predicted protein [Paramuricea clavata]